MNKIVAIVGMCGSGKSVACDFFENKNFGKVYFGGLTLEKLKESNLEINPENEKMMREKLREEYGMGAYAVISIPKIEEKLKNGNVIIDGLYSWDEYKVLKEKYKEQFYLVSVVIDKDLRYERISKRKERTYTKEQAEKRDISEIENIKKAGPISYADYYILNNYELEKYNKDLEEVYKKIME